MTRNLRARTLQGTTDRNSLYFNYETDTYIYDKQITRRIYGTTVLVFLYYIRRDT